MRFTIISQSAFHIRTIIPLSLFGLSTSHLENRCPSDEQDWTSRNRRARRGPPILERAGPGLTTTTRRAGATGRNPATALDFDGFSGFCGQRRRSKRIARAGSIRRRRGRQAAPQASSLTTKRAAAQHFSRGLRATAAHKPPREATTARGSPATPTGDPQTLPTGPARRPASRPWPEPSGRPPPGLAQPRPRRPPERPPAASAPC